MLQALPARSIYFTFFYVRSRKRHHGNRIWIIPTIIINLIGCDVREIMENNIPRLNEPSLIGPSTFLQSG